MKKMALPAASKFSKLFRLIAGRERFAGVLLLALFAGALAESFGLSLALPLLNSLMGLEQANQGQFIGILASLLNLLPEGSRIEGLLVLFAVAFTFKGALAVLNRALSTLFVYRLRQDWAGQLLRHYLHADQAYLDDKPQGALIQNVVHETQIGAKAMNHIVEFVNKLILSVLLLGVLFIVNWQATLIIGTVTGIVLILIRKGLAGYSLRFGKLRIRLERKISVVATESLHNIRQIKLFGLYGKQHGIFDKYMRRFGDAAAVFQAVSETPKQITELSVIVLLAGALIWVRQIAGQDVQSVAVLLGFLILIAQRLISNVTYLTSRRMVIGSALPSLHMIYELLMGSPNRENIETGLTFKGLESDIVCDDVTFAYSEGRQVFDGLHLTISRGKTTAFMGPSGVGKSTLVDILTGFRRPQRGHITINGQNLADYSLESLRQHIGYLTQEPEIFDATVLENVRLGWPDATDEDCIAAAKKARAHDFIVDLPKQYDTTVGDRGNALSVGQRQRLALARVIVREPDLYIFDEPTSALDQESERLVRETMKDLEGEATVIIIAHQLSTIDHADAIYRIGAQVQKIRMTEVDGQ